MEPKDTSVVSDVNEDAELDKSLDETLTSIRAENGVAPQVAPTSETPPETPSGDEPEKPTSPAVPEEKSADSTNVLVEGFKTPTKGKFESEESYQKRLDLADLVSKRKAARTEEEKAKLSTDIQQARRELSTLNNGDTIRKSNNSDVPAEQAKTDDALEADKARLKELGGATKEDIQEIIQQERFASEVKSTLENFINRHPEIQDEDTREVFFDFVDSNYNWANKTGKELMTVLELARENMFKPSETLTERVLKAANVQEKINAMQFPGGTIVKPAFTAEQTKSINELKATGLSEEKALELISD